MCFHHPRRLASLSNGTVSSEAAHFNGDAVAGQRREVEQSCWG